MGREIQQCSTSSDCGISDSLWIIHESYGLYRRAIIPLALLAVGAWHVLMPGLWWDRRNGVCLAWLVARSVLRRKGA